MSNSRLERIARLSEAMAGRRRRFLADLISIRSYTGQEGPAVERTLSELRAIGCDEVWMDSAGNALGRIGDGPRIILYDAHLDTNEVADEREWPHPPLEPAIEGDTMFGLGASDCKGGVAAILYGAAILAQLRREEPALAQSLEGLSVVVMGATLEEDAEGFALRSLVECDGLRPEIVLLAEATDLTLRRGQRGRCEVRVRTEGRGRARQPAPPRRERYPQDAPGGAGIGKDERRPPGRPDLRGGKSGGDPDRGAAYTQLRAVVVRSGSRSPAGARRDAR